MMRRALITGGTGFVGSHVVDAYLQSGWTVRALVRDLHRKTWLSNLPIEFAAGTLDNVEALQTATRDCDVVVHCAGLTKTLHAAEFMRINAAAVGVLATCACDSGVRRFILCSSQAAAGPAQSSACSVESDEPRPLTDYGRSKLAGERLLQDNAKTLEWVVLRPPSVIGPRDAQFVPLFRAATRYGIYPVFGGGERTYSVICVYDLAQALLRAADVAGGINDVYFVAHSDPLDWSSAARHIAAAAGRTVRPLHLSAGLLRGVAAAAETLGRLRNKPPLLSRDKVREILTDGWLCSAEKIRRSWGFECQWPHERMLRTTFESYRRAGLI